MYGVCLEVGGHIVDDAGWLTKENDGAHINIAELEAVVKGVNLALKWGVTEMEIMTDSATVYGWIGSVIQDRHRPRVSGIGEMLVKRRLGMVAELIEAYRITLTVTKVPSARNLADPLTRVPKKWLCMDKGEGDAVCAAVTTTSPMVPTKDQLRKLHEVHHLGVNRTLHLARKEFGGSVRRQRVSEVVGECQVCKSIDPAPVRWEEGTLSVPETWTRVASDITYYKGRLYLTVVDCGPGHFAVWRRLPNESAAAVAAQFNLFFLRARSALGGLVGQWCVFSQSGSG